VGLARINSNYFTDKGVFFPEMGPNVEILGAMEPDKWLWPMWQTLGNSDSPERVENNFL
jgi:hypothetical protein